MIKSLRYCLKFILACFRCGPRYEYGTAKTYTSEPRDARRDLITGEIQFMMFKADGNMRFEDFWYPLHKDYEFTPDK